MKKAYELLERARRIVEDPNNKVTVASLSKESGINDPTLRIMLKKDRTNRTLDNLGLVEDALARLKADGKFEEPEEAKKGF